MKQWLDMMDHFEENLINVFTREPSDLCSTPQTAPALLECKLVTQLPQGAQILTGNVLTIIHWKHCKYTKLSEGMRKEGTLLLSCPYHFLNHSLILQVKKFHVPYLVGFVNITFFQL